MQNGLTRGRHQPLLKRANSFIQSSESLQAPAQPKPGFQLLGIFFGCQRERFQRLVPASKSPQSLPL